MPRSIRELTQAMADGSGPAIEEFYREQFPCLLRTARRITGRDESFCLDVVQEATFRTIRCIKAIDDEPRFRSWLTLVVQSTAYDLLKAEARRSRREQKLALERSEHTPYLSLESSGGDVAGEQLLWLREQIARLDPELARLIDLRYQQAWTLDRMAASVGLSIATIDGRLRRVITRLKQAASIAYASDEPRTGAAAMCYQRIRSAVGGDNEDMSREGERRREAILVLAIKAGRTQQRRRAALRKGLLGFVAAVGVGWAWQLAAFRPQLIVQEQTPVHRPEMPPTLESSPAGNPAALAETLVGFKAEERRTPHRVSGPVSPRIVISRIETNPRLSRELAIANKPPRWERIDDKHLSEVLQQARIPVGLAVIAGKSELVFHDHP